MIRAVHDLGASFSDRGQWTVPIEVQSSMFKVQRRNRSCAFKLGTLNDIVRLTRRSECVMLLLVRDDAD
jgi:hypothetical protein